MWEIISGPALLSCFLLLSSPSVYTETTLSVIDTRDLTFLWTSLWTWVYTKLRLLGMQPSTTDLTVVYEIPNVSLINFCRLKLFFGLLLMKVHCSSLKYVKILDILWYIRYPCYLLAQLVLGVISLHKIIHKCMQADKCIMVVVKRQQQFKLLFFWNV